MRYENNPFNIRFSSANRWKGLKGCDNGFCTFEVLSCGVRAAMVLIMSSYRKKGVLTPEQIISRFAPASENDTSRYIKFVCSDGILRPKTRISTRKSYYRLMSRMALFESGYDLTPIMFYGLLSNDPLLRNIPLL